VLANHDAFFGENLMAQADPASFDFGTAIVTRITAQGTRSFARLMGTPGRNKRLLNTRVADDSVLLLGRVKVGSTNCTQNPSRLSVSDMRDSLALVLDSSGNVEKRIVLPAGHAGRGNEAMSVTAGDGVQVAISGVQNAPGTHAAVFSDAFLVVPDPF